MDALGNQNIRVTCLLMRLVLLCPGTRLQYLPGVCEVIIITLIKSEVPVSCSNPSVCLPLSHLFTSVN